jgi:uncharacterized protein with HEPN domain
MSISAKNSNLLDKILGELSVITEIVATTNKASFLTDQILQRAAVMALLNIGELAAHLDVELRSASSSIPWKKIIGLRNLAAHGYFILDMPDIWKTITIDVPVLKENVSRLTSKFHS